MKILSVTAVLLAAPALLIAGTVPFIGTSASETSGDGHAFHIPNLDGTTVNSDGSVNYNPLTYPPLPFDPQNPTAPVAAGTTFNFGGITYDPAAISGTGTETLPVTPPMFVFDFSSYDHAFGYELAVQPPTGGKSLVTLENITGPGLTFVNGVPKRLDLTAKILWWPTLFTLKQTFTPYTGTLTVVNGKFTFALSDAPARWTLGTGDIYFYFDLVASVPALTMPAPPRLAIASTDPQSVVLSLHPDANSTGRFILQESVELENWNDFGAAFEAASPPSPITLSVTPPAKFFRLRTVTP